MMQFFGNLGIGKDSLAYCSHEEADSGIMAHTADAANAYTVLYSSILTGTMDSTIVVLAVYAFGELTSLLN